MTTLALGENVTLARHPAMLRNVDALIGVFVRVGLPLPDAYRACMETIRTVAGFVEFQDAPHDRPPARLDPADLHASPPPWPTAPDGEDLPHLRRLAVLEPDTPDVLVDGLAARAR
ncbi:hypothetical protein [Actinomadura sp. WAC 06369]|uniref:hypothetical protein n=1 Tax=Actinomadura sp. WAC 06369 TaxID=2203193 RepID=UPI000F7825C2|nr:hypothetical protein [Actinomadura sp. WAC 06369]RSN71682.1 hypothetical protein DMH08_01865 [Actinomadura sp. WAC 06369]